MNPSQRINFIKTSDTTFNLLLAPAMIYNQKKEKKPYKSWTFLFGVVNILQNQLRD